MNARFHIEAAGGDVLRLERAILIYRSPRRSFATVHAVGRHQDRAVILAGTALTAAASRLLANDVLKHGEGPAYLPAEMLYNGPGFAVWWTPPATRHLRFRAPAIGASEFGARVPLPGTLFLATEDCCRVFVVKGIRRPVPATALWRAPYFNVSGNGVVCWGNVGVPSTVGPAHVEAWSAAFFGSYFTHPDTSTEVVRHPDGAVGFWRAMLAGAYGRFPSKVLLPAGLTLEELVAKEWSHD